MAAILNGFMPAKKSQDRVLNVRWGDNAISAPTQGGWNSSTTQPQASPDLDRGLPPTPPLQLHGEDDGVFIVHDDEEAHQSVDEGEGPNRGNASITIQLPWKKRSSQVRKQSQPNQAILNSKFATPRRIDASPILGTAEAAMLPPPKSRVGSPVERATTTSPVLSFRSRLAQPSLAEILSPVAEGFAKDGPSTRPIQVSSVAQELVADPMERTSSSGSVRSNMARRPSSGIYSADGIGGLTMSSQSATDEQEPEFNVPPPRGIGATAHMRASSRARASSRGPRAPSVEPISRRAPSADPYTRRAPSVEPVTRRAPSADPFTRRAPSADPYPRRVPSVEPVARRAAPVELMGRRAPSVEPIVRRAPSTDPYTAEEQSTGIYARRAPSVEPTSRRALSVEPTSRRGQSVEPTRRRAPSVEPTSRRAPSVEPTSRRAPSVEPTSRRAPSVEPTSRRGQSVEPTSRRAPSVEPTSRRAPSVEPTSRRGQSVKPTGRRGQSVEPTSRRGQSVEPTSQRALSVEPYATRGRFIDPYAHGGQSIEPEFYEEAAEVHNILPDVLDHEPLRRRAPSVEPGRRRAPSVDPASRRGILVEPNRERALSVDPGKRAPSCQPSGHRRALSREPRGRRGVSVEPRPRVRFHSEAPHRVRHGDMFSSSDEDSSDSDGARKEFAELAKRFAPPSRVNPDFSSARRPRRRRSIASPISSPTAAVFGITQVSDSIPPPALNTIFDSISTHAGALRPIIKPAENQTRSRGLYRDMHEDFSNLAREVQQAQVPAYDSNPAIVQQSSSILINSQRGPNFEGYQAGIGSLVASRPEPDHNGYSSDSSQPSISSNSGFLSSDNERPYDYTTANTMINHYAHDEYDLAGFEERERARQKLVRRIERERDRITAMNALSDCESTGNISSSESATPRFHGGSSGFEGTRQEKTLVPNAEDIWG